MTSSPGVVEQFVQRARSLYTLPAVAMRVLELTSIPRIDVRALKQCIEADPALTSRILRVVNSSLFGLSREVTDLNQALALLGIKPLKMLVLGFSLPKNMFAALEAHVLSRYWRSALTKAVVAREISQRYWQQSGDEAFIAGLLQPIGQLVLIQDLGEPYVRFLDRVTANGGDLPTLELETLGFDHVVLSARLLDAWGLPQSIVEAVGTAHDCDRVLALPVAQQALPQILHVADEITRLLTSEPVPSLDRLLTTCSAYRRLTIDELPQLLDHLDEKVQQLADVFCIPLGDAGDHRSMLAEAHQQLSAVAEEAALDLLNVQAWPEASLLASAVHGPTVPLGDLPAIPVSRCRVDTAPRSPPASNTKVAPVRVANSHPAVWHDPGLLGTLGMQLATCRQQRQPLSLLLARVDGFEHWLFLHGRETTLAVMQKLDTLLSSFVNAGGGYLGDGRFAFLLSDYDRQQSLAMARDMAAAVRAWGQPLSSGSDATFSMSIGIASLELPPKNFPPAEMIDAAARCVMASHLAGGDTVKSIDLV